MQSQQPDRIMILGHSFVWRLARFIAETDLPCVNQKFQLTTASAVSFHGIGGRTVLKLWQFDLTAIARFNPNIIILEIGSNDLCNPHLSVDNIATNILQVVQTIHFHYHVAHVIISQILPRRSPPQMSPPYNTRVEQLNQQLRHLFTPVPFATFWFHYSIRRSKSPVFLRDGIHLNHTGNHFLFHSYQKTLLRCLSRASRLSSNRRVFVFHRATCQLHRRRNHNVRSPNQYGRYGVAPP